MWFGYNCLIIFFAIFFPDCELSHFHPQYDPPNYFLSPFSTCLTDIFLGLISNGIDAFLA